MLLGPNALGPYVPRVVEHDDVDRRVSGSLAPARRWRLAVLVSPNSFRMRRL